MRTREQRLEEIARLARACREAQRTYFTRRDREALMVAKEQEQMLDDALAWLDQ